MEQISVHKVRKLEMEIQVPGDKSISHRTAFFAGLADGQTRVTGFLNSADCLDSLHAMQALGVETETLSPTSFIITGRNGKLLAPREPIDCGNSGTSMRLLSGILAAQPFSARLFGDASLSRRPMKRIIDPLSRMGAKIECEGEGQRPPMVVHGGSLRGIEYQTPIPSAQVKSCVLLAGLGAEGKTTVTESIASRDHTERMLAHFHAGEVREGNSTTVYGGHGLSAQDVKVPGDFSSAAFWLVAASALPGARLKLPGVGLNPTRTGLINVLMRMGAQIKEYITENGAEPIGTIEVTEGTVLHGTEIGGGEIPNIIDEIPIIAVAAALADGETAIRDARELRVKESDRIAVVAQNLRSFGVQVEEHEDGMTIQGGGALRAARINSHGDHRIAMAFSILGLFAPGKSVIEDTACIGTSYPGFEQHLALALEGDTMSRFAFNWPGKANDAGENSSENEPTSPTLKP